MKQKIQSSLGNFALATLFCSTLAGAQSQQETEANRLLGLAERAAIDQTAIERNKILGTINDYLTGSCDGVPLTVLLSTLTTMSNGHFEVTAHGESIRSLSPDFLAEGKGIDSGYEIQVTSKEQGIVFDSHALVHAAVANLEYPADVPGQMMLAELTADRKAPAFFAENSRFDALKQKGYFFTKEIQEQLSGTTLIGIEDFSKNTSAQTRIFLVLIRNAAKSADGQANVSDGPSVVAGLIHSFPKDSPYRSDFTAERQNDIEFGKAELIRAILGDKKSN